MKEEVTKKPCQNVVSCTHPPVPLKLFIMSKIMERQNTIYLALSSSLYVTEGKLRRSVASDTT